MNILTDRERKKQAVFAYKVREKIIVSVPAGAFARDPERKPKETWKVYKRAIKNANKALKARLRGGPDAQVYIDKEIYEVC